MFYKISFNFFQKNIDKCNHIYYNKGVARYMHTFILFPYAKRKQRFLKLNFWEQSFSNIKNFILRAEYSYLLIPLKLT